MTGLGKYAASATLEGAGGGAAQLGVQRGELGLPPTELYGAPGSGTMNGRTPVGWRGEIDALAAAGIPVPGR